MLRLMLLRHAKSAWPAGVSDRERPLAPRGQAAAPAMGRYMADEGLTPELVLVSPARRTLETWSRVTGQWLADPTVAYEEAIYEAPAERLLSVLRRQHTTSPVMLVGHNPGMEDLARLLLERTERQRLPGKYPTGGLAVIDLDAANWSEVGPGIGQLERFVTPRALGAPEE